MGIANDLRLITAELKDASKKPPKELEKMLKGKGKEKVVKKMWENIPTSKKKELLKKPKKKSKTSAIEKDELFVTDGKGKFLQSKRWVSEFPDADTWEDNIMDYKKAEQSAKDNSGILMRSDKDGNEEEVLDYTEENVKIASLLKEAEELY